MSCIFTMTTMIFMQFCWLIRAQDYVDEDPPTYYRVSDTWTWSHEQ